MGRTEAKEVLEAFQHWLSYGVRTKAPPKKSLVGFLLHPIIPPFIILRDRRPVLATNIVLLTQESSIKRNTDTAIFQFGNSTLESVASKHMMRAFVEKGKQHSSSAIPDGVERQASLGSVAAS